MQMSQRVLLKTIFNYHQDEYSRILISLICEYFWVNFNLLNINFCSIYIL